MTQRRIIDARVETPGYTGPVMKRPVGLILSAIVLSLAALFLLLMTALMAVGAVFANRQPTVTATPHFVLYVVLVLSIVYAALAVWAIFTVIGILRLRSWARYSILIIGGGLAAMGILAAIGTLLSRSVIPALQAQQLAADPHIMSGVFLMLTAAYLFVAAIGVWWLVYFNRNSVRDLFRSGITVPGYYGDAGATGALYPPATPSNHFFSSPAHAPTAIKIIGWLFVICSVLCLPLPFLPIPAFFLGFIVPVKMSHLVFLLILALSAGIGFGLLKLRNAARLTAIAFLCFGIVNSTLSLLPWYQNQFRSYMAQFMAMIPTFPGQPTPAYAFPAATIIFNCMVGVAINIYLLWLLHRHRTSFSAPPPLPN